MPEIYDKNEDLNYLKELYGAGFKTQGYKKLWNYFLTIVKKEYFKKKIFELRKKYNIPENGFSGGGIVFESPKLWRKNYTDKQETKLLKSIWESLRKICKKYSLFTPEWQEILGYYLFYNELQPIYCENSYNLCLLTDWVAEEKMKKESRALMKGYKKSLIRNTIKEADLFHPIAIRISPYATERDIIDYVKKMFPLIRDYQKPYIESGVKIGKIKKKNKSIQERNDFIYENKDLSLNETRRLVKEKFGEGLDYEYIGKIRSEETKKRKEL